MLWPCVITGCAGLLWAAERKLRIWIPRPGFTDLSNISRVQHSARAGKLLLRSKIKAFDWETMPWFDDVGSLYCGQCLLDEDLKWWLARSGHSCQHWVKADIKQHSRGVKIIDNFGNNLNQPTLPSGSNEWFYGPARANDDRIQNWPEKKLVMDKIAQRVIEQIQSHSLSLMHSHIFCDFLLQN